MTKLQGMTEMAKARAADYEREAVSAAKEAIRSLESFIKNLESGFQHDPGHAEVYVKRTIEAYAGSRNQHETIRILAALAKAKDDGK